MTTRCRYINTDLGAERVGLQKSPSNAEVATHPGSLPRDQKCLLLAQ
jgi:hypothetical protein